MCKEALGGGAPSSLRLDNLGKCFGSNLLRMEIEIDDQLLKNNLLVRVVTMGENNRVFLLNKRPKGLPDYSTFKLIETNIPTAKEDQIVVKTLYLSVDPYMRGRMSDKESYVPPFILGAPLTGGAVGKVVESKHKDFQIGDIVQGYMDWADYTACNGNASDLRKIDPEEAPISTALHVAGMPGLTAYFGLLDIGKPQEGETVVISGAAGAVGMVVGQIAKIKGCRVVGIAGSDEKNNYLKNELGFDAVINYKTTNNLEENLKQACPDGIDVYFDNVGGSITDSVFNHLNVYARVPICGQIAHYNDTEEAMGPRILPTFLKRRALLKGFLRKDYFDRQEEGLKQLTTWIKEGKIKYKENIIEGLENAPDAFLGLFRGENLGKQLVKISD